MVKVERPQLGNIIVGKGFKHWKEGKEYVVLDLLPCCNNKNTDYKKDNLLVLYMALEGNMMWYTRDYDEFMSDIPEGREEDNHTGQKKLFEPFESPQARAIAKHYEIMRRVGKIYAVKNNVYGDSFHKTFEEYGPTMLCIRLDDKLQRTKQILLNGKYANDESVIDTLLDLADYAMMGIMELED